MAEILTESFCERCGTRYTFEATAPRRRGLGRIGTLSRGVKNFVSNDDASFSEAMAAAREEDARTASLQQLDAFHRAFSFCMSCRQYTCAKCWNSLVGECLSCAPDLSQEVLPAPFPDLAVVGGEANATPIREQVTPNVAATAWPVSDRRAGLASAVSAGPPTLEPIDAIEAVATPVEIGQPAAEVTSDVELTPEELAAIEGALTRLDHPGAGREILGAATTGAVEPPRVEAAPVEISAPSATRGIASRPESVAPPREEKRSLLARFRPRLDSSKPGLELPEAAAVAEPGPIQVAGPVVEPVAPGVPKPIVGPVAAEPPEPVVVPVAAEPPAPAAEPVGVLAADASRPEAAPAAAEAPEPDVEAEAPVVAEAPAEPPPPAAPSPPTDVALQPTWRMVAPDGAAPEEPQPVLPPAWATPGPATRRAADAMPVAPWAARVATARPVESPVWAASTRDVLAGGAPGAAAPVGIQSCVSCGLSLSANARFCRRCGSRQG